MPPFEPPHPAFRRRVRESFGNQEAMKTIGADLVDIAPGRVTITFPYAQKLTQQHGFLHAGMLSASMDSACGYAALTLMPVESAVLTIEFKVNLLLPGRGNLFRIEGEVVKAGRTIMVAESKAFNESEQMIATMTATMMVVTGRSALKD